jgi:hypothetical protein
VKEQNNMQKKSKWGVGIFTVYGVFAVAILGFVFFASSQNFDLVTDDYYGEQIKHQQQIDREERANSLETPLQMVYKQTQNQVELSFPSEIPTKDISGYVLFFRPSDAAQDKVITIQVTNNSKQTIDVLSLSKGNWRAKVFWKVKEVEYYDELTLYVE